MIASCEKVQARNIMYKPWKTMSSCPTSPSSLSRSNLSNRLRRVASEVQASRLKSQTVAWALMASNPISTRTCNPSSSRAHKCTVVVVMCRWAAHSAGCDPWIWKVSTFAMIISYETVCKLKKGTRTLIP